MTGKTVRISVKTFFFGNHPILTGKTVRILVKTIFFFFNHIIFRTKLQHFLRICWTSQNRKSIIFERAQGPLLVPGGTVSLSVREPGLEHVIVLGAVQDRD